MTYLTAGALREMMDGVPDDAPVIVNVRCVHNDDWFHDPITVDDFGLSVNDPDGNPILEIGEISCSPIPDEHPESSAHAAYPADLTDYLRGVHAR